VELRAAEAMTRAKALASGDKDALGKAVGDLDKQIKQMKADLAAADLPDDVKTRMGASIDALSVTHLQNAVDQFGIAHSNLYARANRMRMAGQGVRADLAISAFERDAKRSMEKMAHECRDVDRGSSILRLISSGNMSIEALLMAVMLMFFEDNAEQLREKLAEMAHKKAQVADLKEHQKALEAAEDPESLDAAITDFTDFEAMTSMQEAIEEAKEGLDTTPGVSDGKDVDEAKEDAKDARSGEASGSEVAKEREASGTEAETVNASASEEAAAPEEGAHSQVTTPVSTPPAAAKKDPVQLSLFKAGTLDPKGTQLPLAFDDLQSKPAQPAVTTTRTTSATTTTSTTVTPAATPKTSATPSAATPSAATPATPSAATPATPPAATPATAVGDKPAIDPAMMARRDAVLARSANGSRSSRRTCRSSSSKCATSKRSAARPSSSRRRSSRRWHKWARPRATTCAD
jgi:hypothetical protein